MFLCGDVLTVYHPGGLLYFPGDSDEASLNPALTTAMLMATYVATGIQSPQMDKYRTFAQGQLNYVMGKNPMNGTSHASNSMQVP